jgi:hypothetical protein
MRWEKEGNSAETRKRERKREYVFLSFSIYPSEGF